MQRRRPSPTHAVHSAGSVHPAAVSCCSFDLARWRCGSSSSKKILEDASGDAADAEADPLAAPLTVKRERTIGQLLGDDDAIDACLARVDARSLMHLKAVSKKWRRRARWVLSDPMSQWRQEPVWAPTSVVQTGDSMAFLKELRGLDASAAVVDALAVVVASRAWRGRFGGQYAESFRTRPLHRA